MNRFATLLITLLFACMAGNAAARESIRDFSAAIEVRSDGSLRITETLAVVAEGNDIKRGIFRDLPTRYAGGLVELPFKIIAVQRNGQPEPHHVRQGTGGLRLYVGASRLFVPPGPHVYTLTYETDYQLGHHGDRDELYWNVTGNAWSFDVDRVSAEVRLPEGVNPAAVRTNVYSGPAGAGGANGATAAAGLGDPARAGATFGRDPRLAPGEGLTLVIDWPAGAVTRKSAWSLLWQTPAVQLAAFGTPALLGFFGLGWWWAGRDPRRGVMVPRWEPPEGMPAAATRYYRRMQYDTTCFTAALLDLAAAGRIELTPSGGTFRVERTVDDPGAPDIDAYGIHTGVYDALLGHKTSLRLSNTHHAEVGSADAGLRRGLRHAARETIFHRNTGLVLLAGLLTAGLLGGLALLLFSGIGDQWPLIYAVAGAVLILVAAVTAHRAWSALVWREHSAQYLRFAAAALCVVGAAACFRAATGTLWLGAAIAALFFLILTAAQLFTLTARRPTAAGQEVRDQIEGLRMYLNIAERDDLARLVPGEVPEDTLELFEELLPYAVALDAAPAWAKRFTPLLEAAAKSDAGGTGRSDLRYAGHVFGHRAGFDTRDMTAAVAGIAGTLGSSISSAAAPPSTSSSGGGWSSGGSLGGSSGGGFSGGGGGGGGGGGW